VETEYLREQQWSERRHRRPQLCPRAAGEAQELDGKRSAMPVMARVLRALRDALIGFRRRAQPGQVAFQVRNEDRYTGGRQLLRHELQRLGLAGTRRAGDEAVTVEHRQRDAD